MEDTNQQKAKVIRAGNSKESKDSKVKGRKTSRLSCKGRLPVDIQPGAVGDGGNPIAAAAARAKAGGVGAEGWFRTLLWNARGR